MAAVISGSFLIRLHHRDSYFSIRPDSSAYLARVCLADVVFQSRFAKKTLCCGGFLKLIMSQRSHSHHGVVPTKRPSMFSKIFRWQTEKPGPQPVSVAIVGTLTNWQKVPLKFDRTHGIWQLTLNDIPGNTTHNYMLLVNGKPANDKYADGLSVPHTEEEKLYALTTARGPRVFVLFSQTK